MEPQTEHTDNGFTCTLYEKNGKLIFFAIRVSDGAEVNLVVPHSNYWPDVWRELIRLVRGIE